MLEIACGTGRVAIPIARQGFAVTGLDVVPGMLELARSKSAGLPVRWAAGDARTFELGGRFRLVFLTGNAFQLFLTNADQEALLGRVRAYLHDEGMFAFETRNPRWGSRGEGEEGHAGLFVDLETRPEEEVRARGQGLPGGQSPLAHACLQIPVGPATGKECHDLSSPEEHRLAWARGRGREALASPADEASRTPLALICQPPPPAKPFPYGDVVPLGFLLRAVNADASSTPPVRRGLEDLLRNKRQGLLWAYHSDTLVTCIDSALVLQGFRDPAGIEALEIFTDGRGGYFPQLCSEKPERDNMTVTAHNWHWCQPEYGTTCLASALRAEVGLDRKTSIEYLAGGYESRGGLYFANPYMMDWALAWALQDVASATALRGRLAADILASVNEDGSFGLYDVPVSTALAILALTSLGVGGEAVRRARLRLAELMMPDGSWPSSIPFYSAVKIPRERLPGGVLARLMLGERQGQLLWLGDGVYAVSLYVDGYRTISSALASLSLMPPGSSAEHNAPALPIQRRGSCHPRYRCPDHIAYIAGYALPPYLVRREPVQRQR